MNESLFEFPCDFPIKVMGKSHPEFAETIVAVIRQFDSGFDASRVEVRPSSGGNYTGLTVTVRAVSREHLDTIYLALTGHPMVKVVL
jgi:putative lipoic acid-binding regulatory protein